MNTSSQAPAVAGPARAPSGAGTRPGWLPALIIVLAGLAVYANSFTAPFIFDDQQSILENRTIRDLRSIGRVLTADTGNGAGARARPLVNLSLAVNYALGGLDVPGYHAFNLAVHLLNALLLFGIARRTLRRLAHPAADGVATAIALLWVVHPLQTETVTCVIQRTELQMAFCLLLTLYLFVRGTTARRPAALYALAVVTCLAGMACKEVMVVAPLAVLLYDRTFVAGSFGGAWRNRWALYLALAGTWLLAALLVVGSGGRGGTVGFGLGVAAWDYALTQCRAVVMYLRLAVWPHPLVLDHGTELERSLAAVRPQALLLTMLLAATAVALWRRPAWGWCGAWFFGLLAPSSSVLPLTSQTMAEHRMYLPLAAVVTLGVLGVHRLLRRRAALWVGLLAVALGGIALARNRDYSSPLGLWQDTVAKCPGNVRGHANLGKLLIESGQEARGVAEYRAGLRLDPANALLHFNLGNALARENRLAEAAESYAAALQTHPDFAATHQHLAEVLEKLGRLPEAAAHYAAAVELDPSLPDGRNDLGNVLLALHRVPEAIAQYRAALAREPGSARLHYNLGNALVEAGRLGDAAAEYEAALRTQPADADTHANLANTLARLGRPADALEHYRAALRLAPDAADIRVNFGLVLLELKRTAEARTQFEAALRLDPRCDAARDGLRRLGYP